VAPVVLAVSNFLVPGPTFLVELVAFLGVLGVLAKWVLPPVTRAMEQRQHTIDQALSDAETARRRAQEAEEEYRRVIEQARAEARALRDEASRLGEQARAEMRDRGEEEYRRLVERAGSEIEASARRAGEELRGEVAGLVMAVVEKVLGEGVTLVDHELLIDRAIAELEREAPSSPPQNAGPASVTRAGT
jgi:F-type H+-transporting ATPase subunit b